jgi:hypothetical protein
MIKEYEKPSLSNLHIGMYAPPFWGLCYLYEKS